MSEYKAVDPPERVTVKVADLLRLRERSAMLAALERANVEGWQGYAHAKWMFEHDPDIQDIKLGDVKV